MAFLNGERKKSIESATRVKGDLSGGPCNLGCPLNSITYGRRITLARGPCTHPRVNRGLGVSLMAFKERARKDPLLQRVFARVDIVEVPLCEEPRARGNSTAPPAEFCLIYY